MDHQMVQQRFAALTTAHLADACIRAQVPVRCASALLRAVVPGSRLADRFADALSVAIQDPAVLRIMNTLGLAGALEQWADSTDVLSETERFRRVGQVYGGTE